MIAAGTSGIVEGIDGVCVLHHGVPPSSSGSSRSYSPPPSYDPGPSAAEIAAQQRRATAHRLNGQGVACSYKNDWAGAVKYYQQALQYSPNDSVIRNNLAKARQALRNTTAHNLNDKGVALSYKNDWAGAVKYYQQALQSNPDSPVIRKNLSQAQEALNDQRRTEDRRQQDATTADQMRQKLLGSANQIVQAPPATTSSLGFMQPGEEGLRDALNDNTSPPSNTVGGVAGSGSSGGGLTFQSDPDHAETRDLFGTKKSNPSLQAADPKAGAVGTNTKALDQLPSKAHNDKSLTSNLTGVTAEGAVEKLRLGFDTGVEKNGGLNPVKVEGRTDVLDLTKIKDPKLLQDNVIKESLSLYQKWSPELQKAKDDVARAEAAVEKAPDANAKAVATAALNTAKSKSDGLKIAVDSAKKQVEERMVYLQKLPVAGDTPPEPKPAEPKPAEAIVPSPATGPSSGQTE